MTSMRYQLCKRLDIEAYRRDPTNSILAVLLYHFPRIETLENCISAKYTVFSKEVS